MTDLLLYAFLKGSIVLVFAWSATTLLRRGSADLRHRIWVVALAGTVLVSLPWPVPEPVTIAVATNFSVTSTGTSAASSAISWLPTLWLAGLTLVLLRFAAGVLRLALITRSAKPFGEALVSDSITSPMTWGAIRPVILLPAYALDWSEEELDVVLRHERAHIARRDWLSQAFAQGVTALFWFHPLVWIAVERLRQEAEQATDDIVLTSGSDAAGYADQLLQVARRIRGNVPHTAVAVSMVRRSALTARIAAILDSSRTRVRAGGRARATVGVIGLCLIAFLAVCQHAKAQVYRVGDGISSPIVTIRVQPNYSEEARTAKWQGAVTVSLVVDSHGRPQNVRVIKPLGLGLDEMAVEAVQKWRFKPGQKNGKPVPVQAVIEVNFRLL